MTAAVLVVMARQPRPGTVKTRLARRVGADAACALYRAFLADIAARLAPPAGAPAWRLLWAVTPADADLRSLVGAGATQVAQRGADLAARMRHVVADLFAGGAARLVMIGADAPHLEPATVTAAFAALDAADVVLTPTRDGGYCLIGLRAPHDLFTGVAMGTPAVLAQTRARADAEGLRVTLLPGTFDVDEWEDLLALRALIDTGTVALPHTAASLATLDSQRQ